MERMQDQTMAIHEDHSARQYGAGKQSPALSVTVLNYNYAHYLPQCLESILSQTWRDFELILINDRSTDNSLEIIRPYLADPRVRLVDHEQNKGFVLSLLEGCELSRGRFITVISADDCALDSTAFETALELLERKGQVSLVYSAFHLISGDNRVLYTVRGGDHDYIADGVDELRKLLVSMPVLQSGAIIRRDAYLAVGGYDPDTHYVIDNIMWLALCSAGSVAYIDKPLYGYRTHDSNMSNVVRGVWQSTKEWLRGVDMALARFSDDVLPDRERLRRRAYQYVLLSAPMHDIFSGRIRRGWLGYWESCRRYPMLTICQSKTLSLILRTVLGPNLFVDLQRVRGHGSYSLEHVDRIAAPHQTSPSSGGTIREQRGDHEASESLINSNGPV
jgi:glycosyltransferase involved in cell wall biosynthesis